MKSLIEKSISNVKNITDIITRKCNVVNIELDSKNEFIKIECIIENFKDDVKIDFIKDQNISLIATNATRIFVDNLFKITQDNTKTEIGLFDYLIKIAQNGANIFSVATQYIIQNDANGTFDKY